LEGFSCRFGTGGERCGVVIGHCAIICSHAVVIYQVPIDNQSWQQCRGVAGVLQGIPGQFG